MSNIHQGLKAIMFDLGGVIIDLHYKKTANLFAKKARIKTKDIGDLLVTSDVLQRYEVGEIKEKEFRLEICQILNVQLEVGEFEMIWNALLGEISAERIEMLRNLRIKTFILSNTNSIHERAFNQILLDSYGIPDLHRLVNKVYFSHEVKMRKPNAEIYEMVLRDQKMRPEEILFIDDRLDNIEAARLLGFRVFLNEKIDNWMQLPVVKN